MLSCCCGTPSDAKMMYAKWATAGALAVDLIYAVCCVIIGLSWMGDSAKSHFGDFAALVMITLMATAGWAVGQCVLLVFSFMAITRAEKAGIGKSGAVGPGI